MVDKALLQVEDLYKRFPLGGGLISRPKVWVRAVEGVSFEMWRGETFGLVGESGCGKTTLGRLILRLIDPSAGRLRFDGLDYTVLPRKGLKPLRRRMQMIFQDPYSSLDPRMKVREIVTEPVRAIQGSSRRERTRVAAGLLERVGLHAADVDKYPHEFSGGQRQRIGIARALCVRPELIVADEPVSALDVSIQAQVINLLEDLKEDFRLSYLFISHDLSVVEHVCDRVAVMYLGRIVESAPTESLVAAARHPYTRALLQAVPRPDPRSALKPFAMQGDVPDAINPPPGCAFHPRCAHALEKCRQERPALIEQRGTHAVACWLNEGGGLIGEKT